MKQIGKKIVLIPRVLEYVSNSLDESQTPSYHNLKGLELSQLGVVLSHLCEH